MSDKPADEPARDNAEIDAAKAEAEAARPETAAAETDEPAARIAELEAELAQTKDALLRAHAEMENLRKRSARELEEARRYAVTGFARDLLEVSDNLGRAVAHIPPEIREKEEWAANLATGVEMTEKALLSVFEKHEIRRVEPERGEKFDHQRHQAMFEVPTDQHPPGTIAEVMAIGYVIGDRLLRPAMVGVAKASAPANEGAPVDETA
jgi:molecular chaperone GrpE